MAHDHQYSITFFKTHLGYLTQTGFTKDINAQNIELLPSNSYGKYSSMSRRIDFFCHYSELSHEILEELQKHAKECETINSSFLKI